MQRRRRRAIGQESLARSPIVAFHIPPEHGIRGVQTPMRLCDPEGIFRIGRSQPISHDFLYRLVDVKVKKTFLQTSLPGQVQLRWHEPRPGWC